MTHYLANESASIAHIWSRFNLKWIIAGALAGIGAGLVMLAFASLIAAHYLGEWSQSIKLLAVTFHGPSVLQFGPLTPEALHGLFLHLGLASLYGMIFAQLVDEECNGAALIVLGLTTSLIVWVFGCALFLPSINFVLTQAMPIRVAILLHLTFGLSFGLIAQVTRRIFIGKLN